MFAIAVLCGLSTPQADCRQIDRIIGPECNLPIECFLKAQELVANTSIIPGRDEYWYFTTQRRDRDQ